MKLEFPFTSSQYVQGDVTEWIADSFCDSCLSPASAWAIRDRYGNVEAWTIEDSRNGDLLGFLCEPCGASRPVLSLQTAAALYTFAMDYHGGGGSRLYRLGCRLSQYMKRHYGFAGDPWQIAVSDRATRMYAALERSKFVGESR